MIQPEDNYDLQPMIKTYPWDDERMRKLKEMRSRGVDRVSLLSGMGLFYHDPEEMLAAKELIASSLQSAIDAFAYIYLFDEKGSDAAKAWAALYVGMIEERAKDPKAGPMALKRRALAGTDRAISCRNLGMAPVHPSPEETRGKELILRTADRAD